MKTTAGRNTKLAKRLMPESEESKAVAAALAKKRSREKKILEMPDHLHKALHQHQKKK